jgi:asparagine synthase (glutamine-hydrolysing)
MCGIAGIFGQTDSNQLSMDLEAMAMAMAHRGPDGEGQVLFGIDGGVMREPEQALQVTATSGGLAHRRLAIIDLSTHAAQPMSDATGRYWLVYNGEVFNYCELRKELENSYDCRFESESDTEVVLQAYITWGEDCLQRFNGMWAFAVWDRYERTVFLARDRFGIKPLFYHQDGRHFCFASEIQALLTLDHVSAEPNRTAVADYLVHGRVDAMPSTFFKGIKQLQPGHHAMFHADSAGLDVRRWWSLNEAASGLNVGQRADWPRRFRELFEDSVKLRLRSDVPVGTCLSGGLDSSAVVCTASPFLSEKNQNAFSARFANFAKDESEWIKLAGGKAGLRQHWIEPTAEGLRADFDDLLLHQEQPFSSTSIYAQYKVFERARAEGVPVTLDGQGADEILAGYLYFLPVYHAELLQAGRLGEWWRHTAAAGALHDESAWRQRARTAGGFLDHRAMIRMAGRFMPQYGSKWVSCELRNRAAAIRYENDFKGGRLNRRLAEVFESSGLPALLRYADRNSMAHSVESRMPFLDHRLVSFVFALPADAKITAGETKSILREALYDVIPDRIRKRHDKIGFETPQGRWFKELFEAEIQGMIANSANLAIGEWVVPEKVRHLWEVHRSGRANVSRPLWRVYCLERWMRQFV